MLGQLEKLSDELLKSSTDKKSPAKLQKKAFRDYKQLNKELDKLYKAHHVLGQRAIKVAKKYDLELY